MTTFRERMKSDFDAMVANEPRRMPDDFLSDIDRNRIKLTKGSGDFDAWVWMPENGSPLEPLACAVPNNLSELEATFLGFRAAVWQQLELYRLSLRKD